MKIVGGLVIVVTASIPLLQPAHGLPCGGGHSFSSGPHFSGGSMGRMGGGYRGGPRYYAGGARHHAVPSSAARNRAYGARGNQRSSVNRTAALNPRGSTSQTSRAIAARRTAALRSQGFDSKGRVSAQASRSWNRSQD